MPELIRNLELALDEMAKTGNEVGVRILENALNQAVRLARAYSSDTTGGNPSEHHPTTP